jgi:hypothetical protein
VTIFWALFALAFVALFVWVELRRSGRFWGDDNPRRRNPRRRP